MKRNILFVLVVSIIFVGCADGKKNVGAQNLVPKKPLSTTKEYYTLHIDFNDFLTSLSEKSMKDDEDKDPENHLSKKVKEINFLVYAVDTKGVPIKGLSNSITIKLSDNITSFPLKVQDYNHFVEVAANDDGARTLFYDFKEVKIKTNNDNRINVMPKMSDTYWYTDIYFKNVAGKYLKPEYIMFARGLSHTGYRDYIMTCTNYVDIDNGFDGFECSGGIPTMKLSNMTFTITDDNKVRRNFETKISIYDLIDNDTITIDLGKKVKK
jgi:hypothetical protein